MSDRLLLVEILLAVALSLMLVHVAGAAPAAPVRVFAAPWGMAVAPVPDAATNQWQANGVAIPGNTSTIRVTPIYAEPTTYRVAAAAPGRTTSPLSDPSVAGMLCGDLAGADGIVGMADFGAMMSSFSLARFGCFRRVFGRRVVAGEYLP